jgi:hypothetical protein
MKQHITPEDINELSENQLHNLKALWTPQEGDTFIIKENGLSFLNNFISTFSRDSLKNFRNGVPPDNYLPLLSIGQMIELLGDDIEILPCKNKGKIEEWYVNGYFCVELCDTLWEVVKDRILDM